MNIGLLSILSKIPMVGGGAKDDGSQSDLAQRNPFDALMARAGMPVSQDNKAQLLAEMPTTMPVVELLASAAPTEIAAIETALPEEVLLLQTEVNTAGELVTTDTADADMMAALSLLQDTQRIIADDEALKEVAPQKIAVLPLPTHASADEQPVQTQEEAEELVLVQPISVGDAPEQIIVEQSVAEQAVLEIDAADASQMAAYAAPVTVQPVVQQDISFAVDALAVAAMKTDAAPMQTGAIVPQPVAPVAPAQTASPQLPEAGAMPIADMDMDVELDGLELAAGDEPDEAELDAMIERALSQRVDVKAQVNADAKASAYIAPNANAASQSFAVNADAMVPAANDNQTLVLDAALRGNDQPDVTLADGDVTVMQAGGSHPSLNVGAERTTTASMLRAEHFLFSDKAAPAEQVRVTIQQAFNAGLDRVVVQLNPEELGRVEVKIETTQDGRSYIVFTAENRDTLDLIQRDARQLERALQDSGIQADLQDMQFNLSREGGFEQDDNEQDAMREAYSRAVEEEQEPDVYLDPLTGYYTITLNDGLDIKV